MDPYDPIKSTNVFAEVFAKTARDAARVSFEQNFARLQSTLIDRLNADIEKTIDEDSVNKFEARITREADKLTETIPVLSKILFEAESNQIRLGDLITNISSAISAFSTDDDDTNLTAAEVATLSALKDSISQDLEYLNVHSLTGVILPDSVEDLKAYYSTLNALTPVEGTVDASGSGSPSNDNRTLLDLLGTLGSLADTADLVNDNTKYLVFNLKLDAEAELNKLEAERLEFNLVELQRRSDAIDNLKAETGNLLRTISISFEIQAYFVESLSQSLSDRQPEPGSVLNLFL
ncbi:MAG: hypothetical protein OEY85_11385 [Rhodospirillales bacterium]|nr:hypothetical protein [Rhodospirillales bacterium]